MESREDDRKTQLKTNPGNAGMEKLILSTNKMIDICSQTGSNIQFDFPKIVVIGGQSAGKSSVLENFVGRDFLPRGDGIITRRPLILQLINSQNEYGEFGHCKGKHFTDFNEISKEIEAETDRGTNGTKGVSNVAINLHIFSPNVLDITLIDLPGITKVPIGDQPEDIENQIRNMILHYISKDNCLILAITPANIDLGTSDALKLAREVDPEGVRTIGVITKLDLMDDCTDARDILENKVLPLRRGYIGIVNRSQRNIKDKKGIAAALKDERNFFLNHKSYKHIADRMGTSFLQRELNRQLTDHIREKLPGLQDKLRKQMVNLEKEVEHFKNLHAHNFVNVENPDTMNKMIHLIIRKLREDFEKEIGGLGLKDIRTDKLSNGVRINKIFHDRLPREIAAISLDEKEMLLEINVAIQNIYGICSVLFPPYMVFATLVRKEIERLKVPVLMCVEAVVEKLTSAVRNCTQHVSNYPNLRDIIENSIISFIHNNGPKNESSILSLIEMELAYMNINHDDFLNNLTAKKPSAVKSDLKSTKLVLDNTNKTESSSTRTRSSVEIFEDATEAIEDLSESQTKTKDGSQTVQNQPIQKGNLCIEISDSGELSQSYWFVLTLNTLSWYENEKETDIIFTLPLNGLQFIAQNFEARKPIINLFRSDGHNVYQNYKEFKLSTENVDEMDTWKQSFLHAFGSEKNVQEEQEQEKLNPELNRDVQDIYEKIDSYMRIVKTTTRDMVPKAITLYIINELMDYINNTLLIELLALPNDVNTKLFALSSVEAEKYKEKEKTYESCKKALEIIRDVSMETGNGAAAEKEMNGMDNISITNSV